MEEETITLQGLNQRFDELMVFLVENMATKEDLKNYPTKEDLRNELERFVTKEDLRNELRGFVTKEDLKNELSGMEQRFDGKLDQLKNDLTYAIISVGHEVQLLRQDLEKLDKRMAEDSNAFAADLVDLKERVEFLENKVRQLQSA